MLGLLGQFSFNVGKPVLKSPIVTCVQCRREVHRDAAFQAMSGWYCTARTTCKYYESKREE